MCNLFSGGDKFDRIMDNIDHAPLNDPGESGSRAFGPLTTNRQVLVPLALTGKSYSNQLPYHDQAM